jgi:heme oxygenase (biliverdin-IX-beta and delta-forming)
MHPAQAQALARLLDTQRIAALGTLQGGEPFVSMVPFALLPACTFVIHVSMLASHTTNMLAEPQVSLMVAASETSDTAPQALARVTIQGRAEQYRGLSVGLSAAREAYLARFPNVAETVAMHDFSFFSVKPRSARFIAGFGQAYTLSAESLERALANGRSTAA